jgi:hypothetical protein
MTAAPQHFIVYLSLTSNGRPVSAPQTPTLFGAELGSQLSDGGGQEVFSRIRLRLLFLRFCSAYDFLNNLTTSLEYSAAPAPFFHSLYNSVRKLMVYQDATLCFSIVK